MDKGACVKRVTGVEMRGTRRNHLPSIMGSGHDVDQRQRYGDGNTDRVGDKKR